MKAEEGKSEELTRPQAGNHVPMKAKLAAETTSTPDEVTLRLPRISLIRDAAMVECLDWGAVLVTEAHA